MFPPRNFDDLFYSCLVLLGCFSRHKKGAEHWQKDTAQKRRLAKKALGQKGVWQKKVFGKKKALGTKRALGSASRGQMYTPSPSLPGNSATQPMIF
jgi:hypothetical protein